jgi:hypothetical protein
MPNLATASGAAGGTRVAGGIGPAASRFSCQITRQPDRPPVMTLVMTMLMMPA